MSWISHLGSPCLPGTLVTLERPLVAECAVSLEFPLLLGDLAGRLMDVGVGERELVAGCLSLELLSLKYDGYSWTTASTESVN